MGFGVTMTRQSDQYISLGGVRMWPTPGADLVVDPRQRGEKQEVEGTKRTTSRTRTIARRSGSPIWRTAR
jgi:hypothetical protein